MVKWNNSNMDQRFIMVTLFIYIFQHIAIYGILFFLRLVTALESIPDTITFVNNLWWLVFIFGLLANISTRMFMMESKTSFNPMKASGIITFIVGFMIFVISIFTEVLATIEILTISTFLQLFGIILIVLQNN